MQHVWLPNLFLADSGKLHEAVDGSLHTFADEILDDCGILTFLHCSGFGIICVVVS